MHFIRGVVDSAIEVFFKLLIVAKTINIFLHIYALCKSYKSFQCYCASCLQPHSYQNLHRYPLTRWWMLPFNLPLLVPAYIPI